MWFWALGVFLVGWLGTARAENNTANYFQSSPQDHLGKEIRLRVASVIPMPELTASDPGYVWMQATTGRPKNEEGTILLRVPAEKSGRLAKTMNTPSPSGHWLTGRFCSRDSGAVLPEVISRKAVFYIEVPSASTAKNSTGEPEEMETSSGSLVVAPVKSPATFPSAPTTPPVKSSPVVAPTPPKDPMGPKAVIFRSQPGEPLQLRMARSIKQEADFCEITGFNGQLSLVGNAMILGIYPLPREGSAPSREQADAALRLYAEQEKNHPEAATLLAEGKAAWEKWVQLVKADAPTTEVENVETAAGMEEGAAEEGYPAWFFWATGLGVLMLTGLVWAWSRPGPIPA